MFLIDRLILLASVLLLIGIVSSKFSARIGLPVLVLFLAVGMLAGEDGIGQIQFDDFAIAHAIGTLALAIILFDGGLQTRMPALRVAWKPSALLATVGVLVTAVVTGGAAAWMLDIPPLTGLLLGGIVASTDAAAVFSVLRGQGLRLRTRVAATLEVESGSNDPMAIFLTVGLVEILTGRMEPGVALLNLFLLQMGVGAITGLATGWFARRVMNRINLAAPGLYPVLAGACGLLAFGLAAVLGGSGFLAIYLAGIVLGNSRLVFQRGTFLFMDGLAWIGQITMFVVLGLLSTPSELVGVTGPGLLIAIVLIFVARPLAVVPLLLPFRFSPRELVLISWVGLKGAVPIILATFPMLFGLPEGRLIFDVVFFVVLVSAILQGWTLPLLASRLGLEEASAPAPPISLELTALRDVNADVVDYPLTASSLLAGRSLSQVALPEGAVVAMISRANTLVPPRGSTVLTPGDHVFVILKEDMRGAVDRVFGVGPGER
jgi:cell volume regulation protein A